MNSDNYRNKSSLEWEKEIIFLVSRDGKFCNKKNGHGCGRSFDHLITDEERFRKMTGKQKKSKIVEIDHINGNSNQRDSIDGTYCGNEQILCIPCHMKKTANERYMKSRSKISITREPTPEMDKNARLEPEWMKVMTNYIYEKHSICMSLARHGFSELSDVTTNRYLKKRLISIDPDVDPIFETGWGRCDSALCNGIHVYFYGNAPASEENDTN